MVNLPEEILKRFSEAERELLGGLLWRHSRQPAGRHSIQEGTLEAKLEEIRKIVTMEFVEKGLEPNDEPNEYGQTLDSLLGKLVHFDS